MGCTPRRICTARAGNVADGRAMPRREQLYVVLAGQKHRNNLKGSVPCSRAMLATGGLHDTLEMFQCMIQLSPLSTLDQKIESVIRVLSHRIHDAFVFMKHVQNEKSPTFAMKR